MFMRIITASRPMLSPPWPIAVTKKMTFNLLLNSFTMPHTLPEGTQFYSDSGKSIVNWPEQHYTNGVEKNKRTGMRFKNVVRAVKNLKNEMECKHFKAANGITSYLIECLVYNVPDPLFFGDSYETIVDDCLFHCCEMTASDESAKGLLEVNENKWLFHATQPWTQSKPIYLP